MHRRVQHDTHACHREAGTIADAQSELAAERARLEVAAEHQTERRNFDVQFVADAVEKQCRRQFEDELTHARSQAQMCLHACNFFKDQLKTAEGKLQELRDETQQAVDGFFVETIARETMIGTAS